MISIFLLSSCGGFKNAGKVLRNEKITTTDEFLVKKKRPLVLPPDYQKVPEPGEIKDKEISEEDKIKTILKAPNQDKTNKNKSSSIEKSILDKIRK